MGTLLSSVHSSLGAVCRRVRQHSGCIATRGIGGRFLKRDRDRRAVLALFRGRGSSIGRLINVSGAVTACHGCRIAHQRLTRFVHDGCGMSSVSVGRVAPVFVASFRLCLHATYGYNCGAATGFVRFFGHVVVVTHGGNVLINSPFTDCGVQLRGISENCLARSRVGVVLGGGVISRQLRRIESLFVFTYFAKLTCVSMTKLARSGVHGSFSNGL